jgi:hypothetical protein
MTTATVLQILGLRLITFKGENMPYKPNKPQVSDYLSVSASDIQNNFSLLGNMLNPDLGTALFPRQFTGAVTAPTTVGLVSKASVEKPAESALFFLPQNGGTAVDFTTSKNEFNGWCRLPCGIILQWGNASVSDTELTFSIPFKNQCFNVQASPTITNLQTNVIIVVSFNLTKFTLRSKTVGSSPSIETSNCNWFAIGY